MQGGNQTLVKEFILLGLSNNHGVTTGLFILFLIVYSLTLVGNFITIFLVWSDSRLHKPMYIFLSNLSCVEIWYTTTTVPKTLYDFLSKSKVISFTGCFLQFYFFFSLGTTECFLLAVMGYDRYLAICHPLRYNTLMNNRICSGLAATCWITGFLLMVMPVKLIQQLPFCGPNEINHFFCDPGPLLELSCLKDYVTEMTFSICNSFILLGSFSFSIISYGFIIKTIAGIPSSSGRLKAFSTCASHLIVVSIFFGCAMSMNMKPSGNHPMDVDKAVIVFYTVVTPLLNPVIYTLRNKEVWDAVKKILLSH